MKETPMTAPTEGIELPDEPGTWLDRDRAFWIVSGNPIMKATTLMSDDSLFTRALDDLPRGGWLKAIAPQPLDAAIEAAAKDVLELCREVVVDHPSPLPRLGRIEDLLRSRFASSPAAPAPDERLAVARECLRQIWQCFDTGGHSMGRSQKSVWLETALELIPYDGRFSNLADLKPVEFDQLRADARYEAGKERTAAYDKERGIESADEKEPMGRRKIDCTMPDVWFANESSRRVAAVKGACARAAGFPKDTAHGYANEHAHAWLYGWSYCDAFLKEVAATAPSAIASQPH